MKKIIKIDENILMNLILDFGNTRTKLAIFDKSTICEFISFDKISEKDLQKLTKKHKIEKVIFASVIKNDKKIVNYLNNHFHTLELSNQTKLPITLKYLSPDTLGKDRIAAACGSNYLFPKHDVLSIDAGTCIKFDFTTKKGEYLGGAISPGINMRFKAMEAFTAKLPLLEPSEDKTPLIGRNTYESMQSGVIHGALAEVNGIIEQYKKKYPKLKLILTGGDANILAKGIKNSIFAEPNLNLIGLNAIIENYDHNTK